MNRFIGIFILLFLQNNLFGQKQQTFTLVSPNQKLIVQIDVGAQITYNLQVEEQQVVQPSPIGMSFSNGIQAGVASKLKKGTPRSVNQVQKPLYGKNAELRDQYNEVTLEFREGFNVVARLYNEGFAYRFVTNFPVTSLKVNAETFTANFREDFKGYFGVPNTTSFQHSYEDFYRYQALTQVSADTPVVLPILLEARNNIRIGLTDADVVGYPAMHVGKGAGTSLVGLFPRFPTKTQPGGWRDLLESVVERADYVAEAPGVFSYPWRVLMVAKEDRQLLENDLVYKLSRPAQGDFSWVKPGIVAWDWWYNTSLSGVPFVSGVNTDTYKYYIDFAAKHGIPYVNIDEGWSDVFDLFKLNPEMNMEEVFRYAKEKNVGLWVWCIGKTLDRQLVPAMEQFAKWGVVGLKVDFQDRDDQLMMEFFYRAAAEAAKNKIMVNFHGATKPAGINKTFPNVLNIEGVRGLEYNKFSQPHGTTPEHAASLPFLRQLAGPMDYTPGALTNANRKDFRVVNDRPMSQGTRCQQLAMYVVFYAPLAMLSDSPTRYEAEPEMLSVLASMPTTWDETRALEGKVSDFAIVARRKGDTWYIGGLTDWSAREALVNLAFLGEGNFEATIYTDGPNAHRLGEDYVKEVKQVNYNTVLPIKMAPGGGFLMKVQPLK